MSSGVGARIGDAQASGAGSVPPAGGLTTTVAGSASAPALVEEVPFDVSSLFLFNVTSQYWMAYTPGAPEWLNQSFASHLDEGAIVWVRRSPSDSRGGITWQAPAELVTLTTPQTLPVPPAGRVTAGAAGTTSASALVGAQDFQARAVFAFDVAQQRYLSYTPGAPSWVNTLPEHGLQTSSIVWISRSPQDQSASLASTDALAAVGSLSVRADSVPPRVAQASPTGATAPAVPVSGAPKPTATAAPKPAASPTATPSTARTSSPTLVSGASIARHLTFEDDYSGEMPGIQANPGGIGSTSESARAGSKAGYAHLDDSDGREAKTDGFRAEYHGSDHAGNGDERWHGISFYFPEDVDQGNNSGWNDRIIFQFADQGSPMFSLHMDVDAGELWVRRKLPERNSDGKPQFETLGRWPFETGQWYDMVFHAEWSTGSSGSFEVYVDGQRRVNYQGRTLAERDSTYSKWGIYGQPTRLLFDEVWRAEGSGTLESVRP